jgi:myo-inositol 2-dehydrogenase / D-chiro-inositol 1-dehydrogenase
MSELKIGVIGCGQIATIAHIPHLSRDPQAKIVALADADPAELAHARVPGASRFTEWRDLIASGEVDAVVIALPTHMHAEAALAAFAAGLHVYLEKPIASSIDDAVAIAEAWRQSGMIGAIGYNYRFNPLYSKLAHLVQSGSIGRPVDAATVFNTPSSALNTWRGSRSTGGGAVLDLATHHIDLLRFILRDEITSVSATIESRETEHDTVELQLEFEKGLRAHVSCAFGKPFCDRCSITGTNGNLQADRARSLDVMRSRGPRSAGALARFLVRLPTPARMRHVAAKLRSPFHEPSFATAMSSFVDAAVNGTAFSPDVSDGLAALLVAEAAEVSAASGLPVTVRNLDVRLAVAPPG